MRVVFKGMFEGYPDHPDPVPVIDEPMEEFILRPHIDLDYEDGLGFVVVTELPSF